MDSFIYSGIDFTIYFYNPNIHPREEYEIRKRENIRYAEKKNIPATNCFVAGMHLPLASFGVREGKGFIDCWEPNRWRLVLCTVLQPRRVLRRG